MPRSLLLLIFCVVVTVLPHSRPALANGPVAHAEGTRNGILVLARCTGTAPGSLFVTVRCQVGPLIFAAPGANGFGESRGAWASAGAVTICAMVSATYPDGSNPSSSICTVVGAAPSPESAPEAEDPPPP